MIGIIIGATLLAAPFVLGIVSAIAIAVDK